MKRLIFKILLLLSLPITFIYLYETTKGGSGWCTRIGSFYRGEYYSSFYPLVTATRIFEGDLGRGTVYAQTYSQKYELDENGFRNKKGTINNNNEVIVIGDSFSCVYEMNLPRSIELKSNLSVLSVSSPGNRAEAYYEIQDKLQNKPKYIVYPIVERRFIAALKDTTYSSKQSNSYKKKIRNAVKYIFDISGVKIVAKNFDLLFKDDYKISLERYLNEAFGNRITELPTTIGYDNILFFNDSFKFKEVTNEELNSILSNIYELYERLKRDGITLVVVPIPDKETIYFDYIKTEIKGKIKSRDFLPKLHVKLQSLGIPSVDLYSAFTREFGAGKRMYRVDDTHWNELGIEIASNLIVSELKTRTLPPDTERFK